MFQSKDGMNGSKPMVIYSILGPIRQVRFDAAPSLAVMLRPDAAEEFGLANEKLAPVHR